MNPILSTGLLIGLLCGVWTFVMGFTGWYKDPVLGNGLFIGVAMAIEIVGLVWCLRKTAALGRTYGGQILAGTMMAIVGGVIIIAASLIFTTMVFPNYFADIEQAYRTALQRQGKTDAEIAAAIQASAASATPMAQAMSGFIGTLVTGIVASAIIGIFVRSRGKFSPMPSQSR
jgi:TM2 domain-containing membrane protein YozV